MPELPDVETFKRYLDATALRQTIGHAHVGAPKLLENTTPQGLGRALDHHRFQATRRHGKWLLVRLDTGHWLVLHFGMSGRLQYYKGRGAAPRYTRLLIDFTNSSHLAYIAPRKLGRIGLSQGPEEFVASHELGPDAMTLGARDLEALAKRRRGNVKGWLMDQSVMAGIGNIYGDEILFEARIHPRKKTAKLTRSETKRLHSKMQYVLQLATSAQADPARMSNSWLIRHREEGERCPRCGGKVAHASVSGRTAWYCPRCQR